MKKTIYDLSKEIWEVNNRLNDMHFYSRLHDVEVVERLVVELEVELSKLKQELKYAITTYKNENETK